MAKSQARRSLSGRGPFWRYALAAFLAAIVVMAIAWFLGSITESVDVFGGLWVALLLPAQMVAGYLATPATLRTRRLGIFLWSASAAAAHVCGEWLGLLTYRALAGVGFQWVIDDPHHFTVEGVDSVVRITWLVVWWGFFALVVWLAWLVFAPRVPRTPA